MVLDVVQTSGVIVAVLVSAYAVAATEKSQTAAVAAVTEAAAAGAVDPAAVRERVRETIRDAVQRNMVTIDPSLLVEGADPIQIPVTDETTIADLLDSVFFAVTPEVRPFTYNKSWVIAGEDLRPLVDMGTSWAKARGRQRDERPLAEAGIQPGSVLIALPKKS